MLNPRKWRFFCLLFAWLIDVTVPDNSFIKTIEVSNIGGSKSGNLLKDIFSLLQMLDENGMNFHYIHIQNDGFDLINHLKTTKSGLSGNDHFIFLNSTQMDTRNFGKLAGHKAISSITLAYWDYNRHSILHSGNRQLYFLDNDRCADRLTGTIKNFGFMVGTVVGFYEGITDLNGYSKYNFDKTGLLNNDIYFTEKHFINFQSSDPSLNFGCERSFELNKFNYEKYRMYSSSSLRFNLYASSCKLITDKDTFVSSFFNSKGDKLYLAQSSVACEDFQTALNSVRRNPPIFNFDSNKFGWIRLVTEPISERDLPLYEGILSTTYGYSISTEHNNLQYKTIYWHETGKPFPYCVGTCYYVSKVPEFGANTGTKTSMFQLYLMASEDKQRKFKFSTEELCDINKQYDMSATHSEQLMKCNDYGWEENSNSVLAGNNDTFCNDVVKHHYEGGVITVRHGNTYDCYLNNKSGIVYPLTDSNAKQDYMIFGSRPVFYDFTEDLHFVVDGRTVNMTVIYVNKDKIYGYGKVKAIHGTSGTPVLNNNGKLVSILSRTYTSKSNRIMLDRGIDFSSNIGTVVEIPRFYRLGKDG